MKHPLLLSCMIMAIPCSLLCQVSVDYKLTDNNEKLKFKFGFSLSSGLPHKINFGPYKTADIKKGRQHFVGRQNESFLGISSGRAGVKNSVSTTNSQPFSLIILQDGGGDSIISNLNLVTVTNGNHALIQLGKSNPEDEKSTDSYCENVMIQVKTDSLNWNMPPTDDRRADYDDFPLSFNRVLTNGTDKILVKGAEDFPVKRKMYENATKGVVFLYNKKQVAAMETYPETAMWISNDLKANHKQVIAAVMITLLSTTKTVMR